VEDPRKPSNGTLHNFQEILVIAICAVLSDSDNVGNYSGTLSAADVLVRRSEVGAGGLGR